MPKVGRRTDYKGVGGNLGGDGTALHVDCGTGGHTTTCVCQNCRITKKGVCSCMQIFP